MLDPETYDSHIDGQRWANDGEEFDIRDPGTGDAVATLTLATADDVGAAIDVAHDRLAEWATADPSRRGEVLYEAARLVEANREELTRTEILESGKPEHEAAFDVGATAGFLRYYAGLPDKIEGSEIPVPGDRFSFTRREPLGVTAHVIPWNSPMLLAARSFGPALACGNAIVAKPDAKTPVTCLRLAELLEEAGLPEGVLNVVPGDVEAGQALTTSPDVDSVTFTGSVETGKAVLEACAKNVTPAVVELGSKSPVAVMDDGDVERAAEAAVNSGFINAGQQCFAGSRLLLHEDVHDAFMDAFLPKVEALSVGHGPDDPDMGPLVSPGQRERAQSYVEAGRDDGATLRVGGDVPDGVPAGGNYLEPTVFDDVTPDMRIASEEIFGPVVSVLTFADYEEMVEIANGTEYGLTAGVFTDSVSTAHRAVRDIEAGVISVNEYPATFAQTPFGGYKNSGIGREKGQQAVEHYTQVKNATISLD